jgi:hypothetical protein
MTVRWLIPGESLLVNDEVFPLAGCHIVLERKPKRCVNEADRVPTVELWFDKPLNGSIGYEITVDSIGAVKMQRVTQLEPQTDRTQCKWLVCVDGEDAVMLRRLIQLHAKQTTQQCLGLNDGPTSAVSTVANTDRRMQSHPTRQPLNHWLEECPNYWDYIDVDHPSYH